MDALYGLSRFTVVWGYRGEPQPGIKHTVLCQRSFIDISLSADHIFRSFRRVAKLELRTQPFITTGETGCCFQYHCRVFVLTMPCVCGGPFSQCRITTQQKMKDPRLGFI